MLSPLFTHQMLWNDCLNRNTPTLEHRFSGALLYFFPKQRCCYLCNAELYRYGAKLTVLMLNCSGATILTEMNGLCHGSTRPTGPRQANLVLIAYANSEGSGEPAHPRSLARTSAARSYKQRVKRNLQTETQIPCPCEWLGMRS